MKDTKEYISKFIDFIESQSNKGKKLIDIKQQKKDGKDVFKIHPVYKNYKIYSINTERSTLPGDTEIPLTVFEIVIQSLLNQKDNDYTLQKGKAQIKDIKIGDPGLEITTLEAIIAIKYYKKKSGESVYRRISAISNILSAAGICENIRSGSLLRLLV